MKKTMLLGLALLSVLVTGCRKDSTSSSTSSRTQVDVQGVVWLNSETILTPGELTLSAQCVPVDSDQEINFALQAQKAGVSLSGKILTIGLSAEDGYSFNVIASSAYDPTKKATKNFTVSNVITNYVEISSEADLIAINASDENLSKAYILTNDIVLTQPWVPIGTPDVVDDNDNIVTNGKHFTGIFDGKGYKISGIDLDDTLFNAGFISQIGSSGVVKNLELEGNIYVSGWSGGVAGINAGTISNVISNVSVAVRGTSAGSIVGVNRGLIENSYGIGKVSSETNAPNTAKAGGLVAANESTLSEVYGDIDTLQTTSYVAFGPTTNPNYMLHTSQMKLAQTWSAFSTDVWYIANGTYPLLKHVGFVPPEVSQDPIINITLENSYDLVVAGNTIDVTYSIVNGTGSEVVAISLVTPVTGVSVNDTHLVFDLDVIASAFVVNVKALITGTEIFATKEISISYNPVIVDDTVHITSGTQLHNLLSGQTNPANLAKDFVLDNDVTLEGAWVPTGIATNEDDSVVGVGFAGTFDGQGYTISGISVGEGSGYNIALFAEIALTGVIENVRLVGSVSGSGWLGGIAAVNKGTIRNVVSEINVYAGSKVGGLVEHNHGKVENVIVLGWARADADAGLFVTNDGVVTNVYADATKFEAVNFTLLPPSVDDGSHIKSTGWLQTASNFPTFNTDIWYIVDGLYPTLKYAGFVPPEVVINPTIEVTLNSSYDLEETGTTLAVSYLITNPKGGETVVVSLVEPVSGVSVLGENLNFDLDSVASAFSVNVRVTIASTEITATKVISFVYNPVLPDLTIHITTGTQLHNLLSGQTNPDNLAKDFVLDNDVTLDGVWTPVGIATNEEEFIVGVGLSGTFDGKGHTISGIIVDGGWNIAFFAEIATTGIVKNTRFVGSVAGGGWIGGIAATNKGTISNVISELQVYAGSKVGGLVEHNFGTVEYTIVLAWARDDDGGASLFVSSPGTVTHVYADATKFEASFFTIYPNTPDAGVHIKSTEWLQTASNFTSFDTNVWNIVEGQYPSLKAL
jgi:hypothetical protein